MFDLRAIFQSDHRELCIADLPALLLPRKGKFGLIDYEKAFTVDRRAGDIFDQRGIDRSLGCIVVVRPDQYVAQVLPLHAFAELDEYFSAFMRVGPGKCVGLRQLLRCLRGWVHNDPRAHAWTPQLMPANPPMPTDANHLIAAAPFSRLLLDLYQSAREHSVQPFQAEALRLLCQHLSFDAAWWGAATLIDGQHHVHNSYSLNVPDDMSELLNLTGRQNVVAGRCCAEPDRALRFGREELHSDAGTAYLCEHAHQAQVMCIAMINKTSNLVNFLSLARRTLKPLFDDREAALLELLMPHLTAMLNISRVLQIAKQRTHRAAVRSAIAVTDVKGILHVTEPGFEAFLQQEWPKWSGPSLPAPMLQALADKQGELRGKQLRVEFSWIDSQVLITLSRKSLSENLSTQERATALAFAQGQSYKEVARAMKLAPTTVRHHLRSAYAKLNVRDKAALANALSNDPA